MRASVQRSTHLELEQLDEIGKTLRIEGANETTSMKIYRFV